MEISELKNTYINLENAVAGYTRNLNSIYSQMNDLKAQANEYRRAAESILDRCATEDDAGRVSDMVNQARAYIGRAESCESNISQLETQIQIIKSTIMGYRSSYEACITEAANNVNNLSAAINKLIAAAGSYGTSKINQTLSQIKQRASDNQQIAHACRNRISWINNL